MHTRIQTLAAASILFLFLCTPFVQVTAASDDEDVSRKAQIVQDVSVEAVSSGLKVTWSLHEWEDWTAGWLRWTKVWIGEREGDADYFDRVPQAGTQTWIYGEYDNGTVRVKVKGEVEKWTTSGHVRKKDTDSVVYNPTTGSLPMLYVYAGAGAVAVLVIAFLILKRRRS